MNIQLIVNGPDSKSLHDTVVITPDIARQIYVQGYLEIERERKAAGDLSPAGKAFLAQLDEQAKPAQPSDSVCSLCGGTQEECQHRRCYGYVNGQRKPVAQPSGDDAAVEALMNVRYCNDAPEREPCYALPRNSDCARAILSAIRANPGLYVPEIAALRSGEQAADAEIERLKAALAALRERLAEEHERVQFLDKNAEAQAGIIGGLQRDLAAICDQLGACKHYGEMADGLSGNLPMSERVEQAKVLIKDLDGYSEGMSAVMDENERLKADLAALRERLAEADDARMKWRDKAQDVEADRDRLAAQVETLNKERERKALEVMAVADELARESLLKDKDLADLAALTAKYAPRPLMELTWVYDTEVVRRKDTICNIEDLAAMTKDRDEWAESSKTWQGTATKYHLERDNLKADLAAANERAADRDRFCDILMTVCELLEIPRCEDGPCDDANVYTEAINGFFQDEHLKVIAEQRDAARAEAAAARAEVARLRSAAEACAPIIQRIDDEEGVDVDFTDQDGTQMFTMAKAKLIAAGVQVVES